MGEGVFVGTSVGAGVGVGDGGMYSATFPPSVVLNEIIKLSFEPTDDIFLN